MKKFRKYIVFVVFIEILIAVITNLAYIHNSNNRKPQILREGIDSNVTYKVTYNKADDYSNLFIINGSLSVIMLISIGTFVYISNRIIKPFTNIKDLPYELAKGNLSTPIKEQKSKYFGKFTWGMDMLRENLEDNKKKELEYQKEKKTLILSLSHDIKTPLSAIKLYSKALEENIYNTEEKKKEAISGIIRNTAEIEHYVNEIVKNSRDDFINLQVDNSGMYLNEIVSKIESYYTEKLQAIHTEFVVGKYQNSLLKADKDRIIEVIQNVIENAIKYGDGKEIKIEFSEEEDCELISIINSGCDLKEEEVSHIFDSFYRGSNSNGKEGNGLGLYICKQLMHKMDGEVYARIRSDKYFEITVVIRKF